MDQFVGEIRLVGFSFAPVGWLYCSGQLLSISDYPALFQLLGTTYGGDGQTTFAIPDLRSRLPIHIGTGGGNAYVLGQNGGQENVTLNSGQLPSHVHPILAQSADANSPTPTNNFFASNVNKLGQFQPQPGDSVTGNLLGPTGQGQSHANIMPYAVLNYIIATDGIYPSTN